MSVIRTPRAPCLASGCASDRSIRNVFCTAHVKMAPIDAYGAIWQHENCDEPERYSPEFYRAVCRAIEAVADVEQREAAS